MARRTVSEKQRKQQLESEEWNVQFIPGGLGPVDLVALRYWGDFGGSRLFEVRAEQVKETRRKAFYFNVQEAVDLDIYHKTTKVPVYLTVKFKGSGPRRPIWKTVKPQAIVRRG